MNSKEFLYKIYDRIRKNTVINSYGRTDYQSYCKKYISYYHKYRCKDNTTDKDMGQLYMTARPNPKAGIGHQIANWIAGYWYAQFFGIKYAYTPFSDVKNPFIPNAWDKYLGFWYEETQAKELLQQRWKRVVLPLFNETDTMQISTIRKIISSYQGQKVVFYLEQDQFLRDQFLVSDAIKKKFYRLHPSNDEKLIYDKDEFNVAVHVRRGDIVQKDGKNNPNLTMRWLDNNYFVNAIHSALGIMNTKKRIHFYVFSQGQKDDYPELQDIPNTTFCLDMDARNSFLHMVMADALITSKSSFSYKPALLNKGIKFCPKNFWHGYPESEGWILLDDHGNLIKENKSERNS